MCREFETVYPSVGFMASRNWFQRPMRLLGFFPEYPNRYQSMLYSESQKTNWNVKALDTPFDIPVGVNAVHIHWQNAIWGHSHMERSELIKSDFATLFAYKSGVSDKKIGTVWTVHNLLPHDSTEIDSELALMRKLSQESDVIHFFTRMSNNSLKCFWI